MSRLCRDGGIARKNQQELHGFFTRTHVKPQKTILYKPHLKKFRKALRNDPTSAEYRLWFYLRQKQLDGKSFRRQTSIENYIVDFYCHSEKLVIELDGQGHYTVDGRMRDELRDARLKELGYTVLRFENKLVFEQLENVLGTIRHYFK